MGVGDPIARQTKTNMGGSDPHVSQRFMLGDLPNQSPSKEDLRRTPLLRSSLDPLDGWRLAVGCRRDPETSGGCREGSRKCRGVLSGDYMPRAALEGTHFFLGENRHAQKLTYFLVLL